jgi:pimeloyl-ACP methyl ester carboxylesterase
MISDEPAGSRCAVEEGELHVRSVGSGPPLLLIAGGLGAVETYRALAKRLSEDYTILAYDRRGHFRSTDTGEGPITVARHADDARAVIHHFGFERAAVFGSSAGALIGLDLAARHPAVVTGLIAHEPPAVRLLRDEEQWLAFADEQVRLSRSGKVLEAFTRFVNSLAGAALPDLKAVRLPNEHEWVALFGRELAQFYAYLPDLAALRRSRAQLVLAAGSGSRGYYHYRPAKALAVELGLPFVETPGAHLAPHRNPGPFAEAVREMLAEMFGG